MNVDGIALELLRGFHSRLRVHHETRKKGGGAGSWRAMPDDTGAAAPKANSVEIQNENPNLSLNENLDSNLNLSQIQTTSPSAPAGASARMDGDSRPQPQPQPQAPQLDHNNDNELDDNNDDKPPISRMEPETKDEKKQTIVVRQNQFSSSSYSSASASSESNRPPLAPPPPQQQQQATDDAASTTTAGSDAESAIDSRTSVASEIAANGIAADARRRPGAAAARRSSPLPPSASSATDDDDNGSADSSSPERPQSRHTRSRSRTLSTANAANPASAASGNHPDANDNDHRPSRSHRNNNDDIDKGNNDIDNNVSSDAPSDSDHAANPNASDRHKHSRRSRSGHRRRNRNRRANDDRSNNNNTDDRCASTTRNGRRGRRKRPRFLLGTANIFSQVFFIWVFKLVRLCRSVTDVRNINFTLRESETARTTGDRLEAIWAEEIQSNTHPDGSSNSKKDRPSLLRALYRAFGKTYFPLALWRIFWAVFAWFNAFWLLRWLIEFQESRTGFPKGSGPSVMPQPEPNQSSNAATEPWPLWMGYTFAAGLFLCALFSSMCFHQLTLQNTRIGIQCRAALMVLIYRKSLRLSYVRGGVGDIVNLISNECNRVAEACVNWHFFWSAGLECAVLLCLAFVEVGIAALPALLFVLFILLPVQYALARYSSSMSYRTTVLVTKRVHLMSEILTAIKLIKFYAWERYYRNKVSAMRAQEVSEMRKTLMTKVSSFTVVFIAPVLSTTLCITMLYASNGVTRASLVFTILSLFNTLRYPLLLLPNAERTIAAATISLKKLEEFFLLPEVDPPGDMFPRDEPEVLMKIENASFIWDGDLDHPHIVDLNLTLTRDKVIGVVGDVGSGKSLLAAVMGQIKRTAGTVSNYGSACGYIPQEPWLINATLRDNILFGLEPDERTYADAIRFSGLTDDILLLSNGDETFVNELNLSPSQKQRISIARCIYHNPDIVLMEDCLSDFDQTHAKRLFKECVRNQMSKGRCVLMLTQQKQFLPDCDMILVLKGGRVVQQGTYLELKARQVNFSAWVSDYVHVEDDPTGVLDKMAEIRLDPLTSTTPLAAKQINPLRPSNPNAGPLSHLVLRSKTKAKPKSSPLALAKPITAEKISIETTGSGVAAAAFSTSLSPSAIAGASLIASLESAQDENHAVHLPDKSQETLRQIIEMNSGSMQNKQLNEQTISKLIERNQLSVLTGNMSRPPANFANQDVVTRTIEANELTVHSMHDFDVATLEAGIMTESAQGRTWWQPYMQFLLERNGLVAGVILILGFFLAHAIRLFSDVWLAFFVDNSLNLPSVVYISVYGSLGAVIAIAVLTRGFAFSFFVLQKSVSLHERLVDAVMRAPMAFYDVTPLGHILSFFARHLFLIDEFLPETALQVLTFSPIVIGTVILVVAVTPYFWVTLPIYIVLCVLIVRVCVSVQRNFQQLEASNKSPMFAHLSTTLEGLFSIRLYSVQTRFDAFNRTLIDADHKALYSLLAVKTLMLLCIDTVASLFIYFTALFVVVFNVSSSRSGLAVSNALQLLLFLPWFIKMSLELHSSVGSVSSVIYFGEHAPREDRDKKHRTRPQDLYWPSRGEIEFKNITLRYHRYGVAVLKSVSFHIQPKEKIAIVGRSGSGKTTILMSLLRITEPAEGQILVDGIDTSTLELACLRSRIAVIPQEPVLFSGTIRSNLDPSGTATDEEIWKALKSVHLADKIHEMPAQLETPVTENGKTFNLSERQLFCIARAIIIKTSIVVFDEPTTSVDKETELLIQSVMRENFADSTLIVLATRFRVIVQTDRVMVMHHGRVVEFDTPLALLGNPKSKFSLMLAQAGDVDPEMLMNLAMARADAKAAKVASDTAAAAAITAAIVAEANDAAEAASATSSIMKAVVTTTATAASSSSSSSPISLSRLFHS